MEEKKTEQANVDKRRTTHMALGLVAALASILVLISWTSFDINIKEDFSVDLNLMEEEIIPQNQVAPPPPPPPPPAPTTVIEIVEDDEIIEDELEIEDFEADEDTEIEIIENIDEGEPEEEEIFMRVEDMPLLPACKNEPKAKREQCTQTAIVNYIVGNTKYPPLAKDAGISGTVFVGFVVDKDGRVKDVEVLRPVHKDLDKEAKRVVESLPKFTPGKQRGKPVSVRYNVPVKFLLRS